MQKAERERREEQLTWSKWRMKIENREEKEENFIF